MHRGRGLNSVRNLPGTLYVHELQNKQLPINCLIESKKTKQVNEQRKKPAAFHRHWTDQYHKAEWQRKLLFSGVSMTSLALSFYKLSLFRIALVTLFSEDKRTNLILTEFFFQFAYYNSILCTNNQYSLSKGYSRWIRKHRYERWWSRSDQVLTCILSCKIFKY